MALPCVNCKQPVNQNDAKFFQGVFVCGTCYTIADRLYQRGLRELNDLILMLGEGIRIALADGRLHLREGPDGELSKKELLEAIVKLQEMKDGQATPRLAPRSDDPPGSKPGP